MMSDVERLIDMWRDAKDEAKRTAVKIAALEELILAEKQPGDTRFGVAVVEGHKLDVSLAKDRLTPEDYDRVCERVPSARKIRELLGDDVLALVQVPTKSYLRSV
jgi:hypothetical protein